MLKKLFVVLILLFIILVIPFCLAKTKTKNDWLCIPSKRVGPITSKSSEEDIKNFFGTKNVSRQKKVVREGTEERITTVIFNGKKDRIEIWWKDKRNFKNPELVLVYSGKNEKSNWKTPECITIGTTLEELNKINGDVFIFDGFDNDFSGTVIDWGNGILRKYKNFYITLTHEIETKDYLKFSGSGIKVKSDDKDVMKQRIKVLDMCFTF